MASNDKEKDPISGVETTGHEWDGLKELNNPMPRWWLWVFFACIVWSVGYWVVYPAWPTLSGHTQGTKGWTEYKKLERDQAEIIARRGGFEEKIKAASLDEIKNDPELYQFALAGGRTMFRENCSSCHGTGGQGGRGYPNLNDDDWIWGGDLKSIHTTIKTGVRTGFDEARGTQMPAFGNGMLTKQQISATADYVLSLSTGKGANAEGEGIFKQQCSACHGTDGRGNRELGAPNLADKIWLYGGSKEAVMRQINNPRFGVMPTWGRRLPDSTIKELSIYVHEMGGGEADKLASPAKKP